MPETRYAIGDLAELADVSRRTVRYYVQEGLLPAPLGVGRGNHYDAVHLAQLLKVKALQEQGRTLDEIRAVLRHGPGKPTATAARDVAPDRVPDRALYRRVQLLPGVELHVAEGVRLPSTSRLQELATWCRTNLATSHTDEGDSDA